jgi:hypothetical protein
VTSVSWPTAETTGTGLAQVLQAAAPARHHDHVHRRKTAAARVGESLDGRGDFRRRTPALHAHRSEEDGDVRGAAAQDLEEIADGRARRGGDHADLHGVGRQGFLAGIVEEALGPEFFLQGPEAGLEFAGPARLNAAHHDLVLPARLVNRERAEKLHLHPVPQSGGAGCGPAEQDA